MKPYLVNSVLKTFLIFIAGLTAMDTHAQDTVHRLSVSQAAEYALKNSIPVRNALIGIDLQRQQNREITAAAFPQITGTAGANYFPNVAIQSFPNFIAQGTYGVLVQEGVKNGTGGNIIPPTDFGLIQAQFGTKYTASAGLDLNQIVFDGQVFVGLQARKTSIQFASKSVEVAQEQIKANVHKIYYQLVAGRQQISTLDANIATVEELLKDTREIYKNGFAEKLDVSRAEVNLTNLQTQRQRVENQIATGYVGLKLLLGMPLTHELVLTDTIPMESFTQDLLETQFNYSDRPDYEQLVLNRRLNEFNVRRYKLSYYPTVSLSGSYYQIAQRNTFNFFKSGEPWFPSSSIGLRINVPIFDGFARAARVQTARLQLEQTNNNLQNLELTINKEIEESRLNIQTAVAAMESQRKNMQLAQEVYDQTRRKYEQGLGSQLEITTAQAELTVAQNNYYLALYDAIVARIDLLRATGKL
jgi:outer membrane protein